MLLFLLKIKFSAEEARFRADEQSKEEQRSRLVALRQSRFVIGSLERV